MNIRVLGLFSIALFVLLYISAESWIWTQSEALRQSTLSQAEVEAWEEDIRRLASRMEDLHPNLFFSISQIEFQNAIEELIESLPTKNARQIEVEIMRLVALIGDGHTWLLPQQRALSYQIFPLRLYEFSDGFFITDVAPEHADALGARLLRIASTEIAEITERLKPLVSHDNEMTIRERMPQYMLTPEILQGIGVLDQADAAVFTFENSSGTHFELEIQSIATSEYFELFSPMPTFAEIFPFMLPQRESPLYLSNLESNFWVSAIGAGKTLYIQYNAVQITSFNDGRHISLAELSNDVEEIIEEQEISRLIIDLRHNLGGEIGTFGPLYNLLISHEDIQDANELVLLLGRRTYSAAAIFTDRIQANRELTLIGEPSGAGLNFYADNRPVVLPNSRIEVRVSTRTYETSREDDRLWHEPDILIGLSSESYFDGADPVFEAALQLE